jgi:two-component system, OmpR family, sensor kinase
MRLPGRPGRAQPRGYQARLVSRAQRIIIAQVAGTVTLLVFLAGAVAYVVLTRDQSGTDQRQLTMAATRPMIDHPPPGAWEFRLEASVLSGTKGAPAYLPVRAAMRQVAADRRTLVASYALHGVTYLVRTQAIGDEVVQVALDTGPQERQREELYAALAFFEVAGLAAAAVTGRLLSRRAIAPLGAAIERQSRFVADATHELRTPLTQLHTRAQLLQRRLSRDPGVPLSQAEIDAILASTRQFGEVIEDVLRSAQAADSPALRAPVDLTAIVEQVAEAESVRALQAGIAIAASCQHEVRELTVSGVASALRRVVTALVDNALAHTPRGGHIEIRVMAVPGGREIEVSVRDDGTGFRPGDGARIFERGTTTAEPSPDEGDSPAQHFGIGLALVREIIESHGGTVTASALPDRGACFAFRLPHTGPPGPPPRPGHALARRFLGGYVGGNVPKRSTD